MMPKQQSGKHALLSWLPPAAGSQVWLIILGVETCIKPGVLAVCWFGAFMCVLTQCQEQKTSAMALER